MRGRPGLLATIWLVFLACLIIATILSILIGARELAFADVLSALLRGSTNEAGAIIWQQRIPRTLAALLGGAALAAAGALTQGHTRNPLADPGLVGVTSGAAFAVVVTVSVVELRSPLGILAAALVGAAVGTLSVLAIAVVTGHRRDASPAALVLAGSAVSALLSALTGILLLLDVSAFDSYRYWTVGSLAGVRDLSTVVVIAPILTVGIVCALMNAPGLDALILGDDVASSLGRHLRRERALGLVATTLLAGGAVCLVGSLGFVGLVAPHLARALTRDRYLLLIPTSALLGALLTVSADILGRVILPAGELPVGIVFGVIGGPIFCLLVLRLFRTSQ